MATPDSPQTPFAWNEDLIFEALADRPRRRILVVLAARGPTTASDLTGATNRRLDATLKQLVWLRNAGLVVQKENPGDGRKCLYALAPNVPLTQTEKGKALDFGFLAVRW
jgi:DNA-binding transcriptional ArsR family regulator